MKLVTSALGVLNIVVTPTGGSSVYTNLLSYLAVFSVPSACPAVKKRYVPIPAVVWPNPTTLDLTRTSFTSVLLVNLTLTIPLAIDAPNVPIKFPLTPWSLSK